MAGDRGPRAAPSAPLIDPVDGAVITVPGTTMIDQTSAFRPAIMGVRGATTAVTVVLCSSPLANADWDVMVAAVVVVTYNVVRILKPLEIRDDLPSLLRVLAEVIIHVLAVVATGYWDSPFVFSLLTAIMVAGFARGFGLAVRVGVASVVAVALPDLLTEGLNEETLRTGLQWATLLLLVAAVSGYARHINVEADRQHSLALDRLGRLSDANALLFALHRVAQSLPSLARPRRRPRLDHDPGRRPASPTTWPRSSSTTPAAAGGARPGPRAGGSRRRGPTTGCRPRPATAVSTGRLVVEPDLTRAEGPGLGIESRTGPLRPAAGPRAGHGAGGRRAQRGRAASPTGRSSLLEGFVDPAALAVDNARVVQPAPHRRRRRGAHPHRPRPARPYRPVAGLPGRSSSTGS